ncbi:GNAT family N-acetyltransferase [Clostridium beijerinckii]|uniref:GNAT family N-acetyltransferase n=2 Tax=Clostridium beijerinckii TaxID=1520 RepID=UPI0018C8AFD7
MLAEIKEGNHKFYIGADEDNIKAVVTYMDSGENNIILDHTFVSPELRGKNIGQQLVKRVVDFARQHNKKIIPQCWFAEEEFVSHKEYEDVWFK